MVHDNGQTVKPKRSHHKKKARARVRDPKIAPASALAPNPIHSNNGVKRPRKVFGRRKMDVNGISYLVEMQVDGVRVTEKGGRAFNALNWRTLIYLARRQSELFDRLTPAVVELLRESLKQIETFGQSTKGAE